MNKTRILRDVEEWFDGEGKDDQRLEGLVESDPELAAHVKRLQTIRDGVRRVASRQEIRDPQFPAFMEGIREGIQQKQHGHRGLWALVSLAAAALIVAVSLSIVMMDGQPHEVSAEVSELNTELEDIEIHYYNSDNGVSTVWVDDSKGDL